MERPLEKKEYCNVCFMDIIPKEKRTYTTNGCKCKPRMHEKCFTKWIQHNPGTCPICKKKVVMILQSSREVDIVEQEEGCSACFVCICASLIAIVVH